MFAYAAPVRIASSGDLWHKVPTMARPRFVCLILALVTLLLYLPVWQYGFLVYDDDLYVTENWRVQAGLSWAGVKWAFSGLHASNWHPLTWVSHMLDCELFGMNPGPHHGINVLLHCANAVLLFLLLWQLTQALWPAAFVAALFAWHPLHIESVAWIAERKDVLCALFGLLSLRAYARYAQSKAQAHYALALLWFALGLMAKPMLVTLPFVFLLLDVWPLARLNLRNIRIPEWRRLALEKWPFFLLTAASCVVTFVAQREEAMMDLEHRPFGARVANAVVAYSSYLMKTVWPADLAIIYPLPEQLAWWKVALSGAVLLTLSVLAWRGRTARPSLLIGWLWFLGMLVPVIGLVQVGRQAMADRYTYLPLIGVFIAIAYGARDLRSPFPAWRPVLATVVLAGCVVGTYVQLMRWRDNQTLFAHTVAVTAENPVARVNLGVALEEAGRTNDALVQYREALRIDPNRPAVHNNIANVLSGLGKPEEALAHYGEALRLKPNAPLAHLNLGTTLVELGRHDEGMRHYAKAARLAPDDPRAPYLLGKGLLKRGQTAEAIAQLREALRRHPSDVRALVLLAKVLASDANADVRDGREAVAAAERATDLTGGEQPHVLDVLAMAYAEAGRFEEAQRAAQRAVELLAQGGWQAEATAIRQRLELYRSRQPYREAKAL
jgi:tetratricopeptide (TPR) repeat protein